ncbi:MAG: hypothetical protein SNJ56_02375, partial [Termitinemataceae bacterium]
AVTEFSPRVTDYGKTVALGKLPDVYAVRAIQESAAALVHYYQVLAELGALQNIQQANLDQWTSGTLRSENVVPILINLRRSIETLESTHGATVTVYNDNITTFQEIRAQNIDVDRALVTLQEGNRVLDDLSQLLRERRLSVIIQRYAVENTELQKRFAQRTNAFEEATALTRGISITPSSGAPYIAKYPAESIPIFNTIEQNLNEDIQKSQGVLADYRSENPPVLEDPQVRNLRQELETILRNLQDTLSRVRTARAAAQQQVDIAQSLRLEGDRRYTEAQTALRNQNFDLARQRLQQAGERYDASLAVQESSSLRNLRDQRLLSLAAEISKTENEAVVRDVRRLITEAKRLYFVGDFNRAEDILVQAQSRWKTTNVDDEPEVTYWLTLTRSALSIKTGRTISPTAPLYPEMSQLLSAARKAYEEGKSLLAARKRTEALAAFDRARENIQKVRILFPINQEASLLELQIDQLIDPAAFTANFKKKLDAAQAKLNTQPQEGYAELQDLFTINPSYPGLRTIIEKAEIQLGLRLPPPDPRAIARSNELVVAARRIIDANIRSQFPVALEQLNEALKLNPNNDQAIALKDRIQTDVGGQAAVVLSSAAEREYQRAVQELQNGNTIVALTIVEQLLQDPKNRNSTKLVELKRRIESRL